MVSVGQKEWYEENLERSKGVKMILCGIIRPQNGAKER